MGRFENKVEPLGNSRTYRAMRPVLGIASGACALLWALHVAAVVDVVRSDAAGASSNQWQGQVQAASGGYGDGGPAPDRPPALSITYFGAKGDGHTDDTVAIQTAVNRAAAEGRSVVVPPGTYMVSAAMTGGKPGWAHVTDTGGVKLPSHTVLTLLQDATLKAIPHGGYGGNVLRVLDAHDITIEGPGRLLGDRPGHDYSNGATPQTPNRTTHEWNAVISIRGGRDVVIRGVTIAESSGDGITIGAMAPGDPDTARIRVVSCRIDGSRRNNISVLGRSADVFITSNVISNSGINDSIETPARISGVPPRAGIDVEGGYEGDGTSPRRVLIEGNSLSGNWGPAISSYNGIGVVIQGNYADSSVGYAYSSDVAVIGNTVQEGAQSDPERQRPWQAGVTYRKGDKVRAEDAVFVSIRDDNRGRPPEGGKGWWMTFAPPGIYGIGLATGMKSNNTAVTGNTVSGFATGIDVRGVGLTVSGNALIGQRGTGILVYDAKFGLIGNNQVTAVPVGVNVSASTANVAVTGNQINAASRVGILSQGRDMAIRGNILRDALVGVHVGGGSASVSGNQVEMAGSGPNAMGVRVSGEKTRAMISDNTVYEPPGVAIGVFGSETIIRGNSVARIAGNGPAIAVEGATGPMVLDNLVTFARREPGGVGISIMGSNGGIVTGNRILSEVGRPVPVPVRAEPGRGHRVLNNLTSVDLDDQGTPDAGKSSSMK